MTPLREAGFVVVALALAALCWWQRARWSDAGSPLSEREPGVARAAAVRVGWQTDVSDSEVADLVDLLREPATAAAAAWALGRHGTAAAAAAPALQAVRGELPGIYAAWALLSISGDDAVRQRARSLLLASPHALARRMADAAVR